MTRRQTSAFTLVEMLVVVAIIGTLIGLLVPAVQSARESARRMECSAHLKEIGTALHTYHSMYMNFPINYGAGSNGRPPDSNNQYSYGRSWILGLLPFIDEQRLYDKVDFTQPLNYTDGQTPPLKSNLFVASSVIQLFLCPSDREGDGTKRTGLDIHTHLPNQPIAVTNYKAVAGSNWDRGDIPTLFPNLRPNPHRDDLIIEEDKQVSYWVGRNIRQNDGLDRGNGFICRGNANELYPTSIRDILDGTSNTLAVGEAVPRWCEKSWWYGFDAATATAAIPLNYKPNGIDPLPNDTNNNYSFMSRHQGGGYFTIADGSVRFVEEGIDLALYRDLANLADGYDARLPE